MLMTGQRRRRTGSERCETPFAQRKAGAIERNQRSEPGALHAGSIHCRLTCESVRRELCMHRCSVGGAGLLLRRPAWRARPWPAASARILKQIGEDCRQFFFGAMRMALWARRSSVMARKLA